LSCKAEKGKHGGGSGSCSCDWVARQRHLHVHVSAVLAPLALGGDAIAVQLLVPLHIIAVPAWPRHGRGRAEVKRVGRQLGRAPPTYFSFSSCARCFQGAFSSSGIVRHCQQADDLSCLHDSSRLTLDSEPYQFAQEPRQVHVLSFGICRTQLWALDLREHQEGRHRPLRSVLCAQGGQSSNHPRSQGSLSSGRQGADRRLLGSPLARLPGGRQGTDR
jgi:hypothetical protein